MHLSDELLSAYLDGELEPSEITAAAAHLGACASCSRTASLFGSLDERLTAIPALACASAGSLVSAHLDGEISGVEATVAAAHLARCADCRDDVLRWSVADLAIAGLPAAVPSARVDTAIAALGREPARRVPRIAWSVPAFGVALALSLAIVFNLSLGPSGPLAPNVALVAAVQQSVFNPQTGTLYVLHPENGTVAALDAQTLQERSVITVGGKPTALALNSSNNTILVLDASAKTLTEIDGAKNTVTSSTAVAVPGRPTSLQVDPSGNVVVSAVVTPAPGQSAAPGAAVPGGVIAVFNPGTKQVQSVRQVEVAPQVLVLEPNGRRALLVSAAATTLVDANTYQPLATAAGGVGAAFAATGDDFAILSSSANGASVSFARRAGSVFVGGAPHAIAALPDGGFAVLADSNDRGVITLLAADGSIIGTLDVLAKARDLAYDPATRQFTVISAAGAMNVSLPALAAQQPQPGPATAGSTASPLPTAQTTPKPSATPSPAPTEPVTVIAPRLNDGLVPTGARAVWAGTYLVITGLGNRPERAAGDGSRIWYVDDLNRVNALNTATGQRFQIATLPAAASIGRIALSPNHVYLIDPTNGVLYALTIGTEQLVSIPMPYAIVALSAVASPDERLWLGTGSAGLVGYDPRTGRIEQVAAGLNLSALATDALGRVWIGGRERQSIEVYDPLAGTLTDIAFSHDGAVTALVVDRSGALWVGTNTGQAFAMRNTTVLIATSIGRSVDELVLDQSGAAVAVSLETAGLVYGPATGLGASQTAPVGSSGPIYDQLGRVWQADQAAAGFYVTLPPGQR